MVFLLFMLLGALAGTLAGLFGIGGGLIIVPVLVYSLTLQGIHPEVVTHIAVGTSLASIMFTSINSVFAHHQKGAVNWSIAITMGSGIIVGSVLGGLTAAYIPGDQLQVIIGLFALIMALQMTLQWRPQSQHSTPPSRLLLSTAGGIIGWASAIFGIGGGSLGVPFLTWRGLDVRQAVGVAAACGLPIALSGACTYMWVGWHAAHLPEWSLGYVYLPALLGIVTTSMLFARFGARLAHRLPPTQLKRCFAIMLAGVGLNFLF